MNSSTPHRRRRLVIVDSPNSESSFGGSVTTSTQSFDHDADETHIMAPCNEVGNLVSSMNNVTVSENNSSETSRRRKCKRGGISCLDFESDDSDSSIEIIFTPVFKPKSTPIVLLDDSFYESSSDDSIQIIAASNTSKPRGKANLDGNKTAWTRSGDMYVLTSTPKTNNMPNLRIPSSLYDQLFDHQRSGVAWMAGLHTQKIGGLLGDDMGMGKTYMALTLVGGLMAAHSIRNALIVAPLSVLRSWETEAGKVVRQCLPKVNVEVVSSDIGKPTRCKRLRAALEW